MSQVSRSPLNKKLQEQLLRNFFSAFLSLKRTDQVELFLGDLLTRTEKIVLAKRLAIALMLLEESSYAEIKSSLKVSSTTVAGINNLINEKKGYREMLEKLKSLEKHSSDSWLISLMLAKTDRKYRAKLSQGKL